MKRHGRRRIEEASSGFLLCACCVGGCIFFYLLFLSREEGKRSLRTYGLRKLRCGIYKGRETEVERTCRVLVRCAAVRTTHCRVHTLLWATHLAQRGPPKLGTQGCMTFKIFSFFFLNLVQSLVDRGFLGWYDMQRFYPRYDFWFRDLSLIYLL